VPKWPVKLILVAFILALPLKAGVDNIGRFNRSDKNSQAQARAWVEQHVRKAHRSVPPAGLLMAHAWLMLIPLVRDD
jgi:hypothetical protein